MNYQMPISVRGNMLLSHKRKESPDFVPMEIECELQFENGVSSTFYNSFATGHQQWAHVSGTEGVVYIPDFVLPFAGDHARFSITKPEFVVNDCDFEMQENREEPTRKRAICSADSVISFQAENSTRTGPMRR
jgi:hypothetical protein